MLLRRCAVSLLSFTLLPSTRADSFENTAIVRTIELGGSLVHVTTTFAVKALEAGSKVYTVALGDVEKQKTSWLEAKVKGQPTALAVLDRGADSTKFVSYSDIHIRPPYSVLSGVYLVDITLPQALGLNATVNIVLDTIQTHATYPWPERASQQDDQALKYETDLFVLSPYHTAVQRTKIRCAHRSRCVTKAN
jgi:oligosaccharyltransferase complex subunit alpha (ribophorin I)